MGRAQDEVAELAAAKEELGGLDDEVRASIDRVEKALAEFRLGVQIVFRKGVLYDKQFGKWAIWVWEDEDEPRRLRDLPRDRRVVLLDAILDRLFPAIREAIDSRLYDRQRVVDRVKAKLEQLEVPEPAPLTDTDGWGDDSHG